MKFWTKPIYIRFSVKALLLCLLLLSLLLTGIVFYKNYIFHNWFFKTLSTDKIEAIYVYNSGEQEKSMLTEQETEAVVSLLRNVRLKEEPYKNYKLLGDRGNDYHIKLKSGISFDLNLSGGDPGVYIFNGNGYSVGYRDDPDAAEAFENLWRLEELYRGHTQKYYP